MRTIDPLTTPDQAPNRVVKMSERLSIRRGTDFMINDEMHHNDKPVTVGELQVWDVVNDTGMDHPFHLHGFFFQVLERDGAPPDAVPALFAHHLTPVLNSLAEIAAWNAAAATARRSLDAAIHIDTGMNRLGLPGEALSTLAGEWKTRLKNINLVLLMSHLASGDEPNSKMNDQQLARFRTALAMLPPAPASLAASGGSFLGKPYWFDLVRPGIGLFGGAPQEGGKSMKTVAVLTGRVLQLRRIDSGQSVGYAATFRAKRPTMIATVAPGYAAGIPRTLSNKGVAFAAGKRVPFVGRVSMDMIGMDFSDVTAKVGDTVELLGDHVTLEEVAALAGTNAYEILTGLKLPRHYTDAAS